MNWTTIYGHAFQPCFLHVAQSNCLNVQLNTLIAMQYLVHTVIHKMYMLTLAQFLQLRVTHICAAQHVFGRQTELGKGMS